MNPGVQYPMVEGSASRCDAREGQPAREGNVLIPEACETMSGDQFAAYMDLQQDGR